MSDMHVCPGCGLEYAGDVLMKLRAEHDALRALLMRAKDVLNDVAYPDGDVCVNADAEEMASSIDAALRCADKLAEGRDEN